MTDFLFGTGPASIITAALIVGVCATVACWLLRREFRVYEGRLGGTIDLTGVRVAVVAPDPDDFGFVDFLGWDAPGRFADFRDEAA